VSLQGRLSSIVRRPAAALSARLGRGESDAGGRASPDDLSAYQTELRRLFMEPTGLEPAVRRRGPTSTQGDLAGHAPDDAAAEPTAAEPGAREPQRAPASAPAPSEPGAPVVVAARADAPATGPQLPTPITPAPPTPAPAPTAVPPPTKPRALRPDAGPVGRATVGSPAGEIGRAAPGSGTSTVRARVLPLLAAVVAVASIVAVVGGALIVGAFNGAPDEPGAPPASAPPASAAPPTSAPAATLPPGVAAGLLEVTAVNDRLARAAADLDAALSVRRPSASVIGPLLRAIASDVRSGRAAVDRVVAWRGAGTYPAETAAFYDAVALVAADGLGAALGDDAAYAASGRRMLEALASLPDVAAATRASAARAGVAVPTPAPSPAVTPATGG